MAPRRSARYALTVLRTIGRGNRGPTAFVVSLLLTTACAVAQSTLLRLETETAGVVRVRGPGVQGVDWNAAGRSSVIVPLLIYDAPTDGPVVDIDGRAVRPNTSTANTTDPVATYAGPVFDDDAYQLAALWHPGRSDAVRRWTLTAVVVFVLVLAVARYADPKRATLWTVVAAVGLSGGAVAFFPKDSPRRVLRADGQPGWEWVWRVGDGVVEEPWTPRLRFVPASRQQLATADPVLTCDAAGRPVSIRCRIAKGERVVFARPRPTLTVTPPASRP